MKVEKIEKQFKQITRDTDQGLVCEICSGMIEDYKRKELGYGPRCNLEAINREDKGENELRNKIHLWVKGFLGLRSKEKITYIEQMVGSGQENSVK